MNICIRKGITLLPCILLTMIISGQSSNNKKSKTKKKPVAAASENTLLWRISGNGLPRPSYIFGTMHLLCKDDAKLSDSLQKAIEKTDQVYFEIDLDDMN